jgi:hypothetical protein
MVQYSQQSAAAVQARGEEMCCQGHDGAGSVGQMVLKQTDEDAIARIRSGTCTKAAQTLLY